MSKLNRTLSLSWITLLSIGCIQAEVDFPEACVGGLTQFVPAATQSGAETADVIFDWEGFGSDAFPEDLQVDLRFLQGRIIAQDPTATLDFVDTLRLEMSDPNEVLPAVLLADVQSGTVGSSTGALTIDSVYKEDLVEYLTQELLEIHLQISGQMPAQEEAVDLEVCFGAGAAYEMSLL